MGVSFGRSRVGDLSFLLFERSLHPDWFATRAHRRVGGEGWEADVRIIEGGHTVTWRAGPERLTEVLVGASLEIPETGLIDRTPVRRDRAAEFNLGRGTHYESCLDVERLDAEVFSHLTEEMTLDGSKGDLFVRFGVSDRMAPPPLSRVHLEIRGRGISVQAFHTFPAERAIVRTLSLFEVGRQA